MTQTFCAVRLLQETGQDLTLIQLYKQVIADYTLILQGATVIWNKKKWTKMNNNTWTMDVVVWGKKGRETLVLFYRNTQR